MTPTVYLAGPITGLTYDGSTEWRDAVSDELADAGIVAYSPLRAKHYLRNFGALEGQYQGVHPLSDNRGIVTRDHNDVTKCDAILVNLLGAERISIGTCWELGVAFTHRKPVVLVMETGNPHAHAMVTESAGFIVDRLEDAVDIVKAVLRP